MKISEHRFFDRKQKNLEPNNYETLYLSFIRHCPLYQNLTPLSILSSPCPDDLFLYVKVMTLETIYHWKIDITGITKTDVPLVSYRYFSLTVHTPLSFYQTGPQTTTVNSVTF